MYNMSDEEKSVLTYRISKFMIVLNVDIWHTLVIGKKLGMALQNSTSCFWLIPCHKGGRWAIMTVITINEVSVLFQ